MSLDKPLPSRYRVVEKDGRLIVTDTKTGQRNASASLPTMTDLRRGAMSAPPAAPLKTAPVSELSTPKTKRHADAASQPAANPVKLIVLAIAGLAALAGLMLSGLWIAVVIALLIPQVRAPLLTAGRNALKRWFAA